MKNCTKLHFIREYLDDQNITRHETIEDFFIGGALLYEDGKVIYQQNKKDYALKPEDLYLMNTNNSITINHLTDIVTDAIVCIFSITVPGTEINLGTITGDTVLIDWGDGTIDGSMEHTYTYTGIYTTKISGGIQIGGFSFWNIDSLVKLIIGNSVTEIGAGAIACRNLKEIIIGKNVQQIGSNAIAFNDNLSSVICLAEPTPIFGNGVFFNGSYPIYVPLGLKNEYRRNLWKIFGYRIHTIEEQFVKILPIYDAQSLKQNLECRCSIIRGELDYNVRLGIPLKTQLDEKRLAILNIINQTPGVESSVVRSTKIVDKKFTMDVEIISNFGTFVISFS